MCRRYYAARNSLNDMLLTLPCGGGEYPYPHQKKAPESPLGLVRSARGYPCTTGPQGSSLGASGIPSLVARPPRCPMPRGRRLR